MEIDHLIELHSEQCNRLVHGQCQVRGCLVRGGWIGGNVDYDLATCLERETVLALQAFMKLSIEARGAAGEYFHGFDNARLKPAMESLRAALKEQEQG